jgi:hypothetical protein
MCDAATIFHSVDRFLEGYHPQAALDALAVDRIRVADGDIHEVAEKLIGRYFGEARRPAPSTLM